MRFRCKKIFCPPRKEPDISEFAEHLEQAREWAASEGMSKNDISEAVKAVRKKS